MHGLSQQNRISVKLKPCAGSCRDLLSSDQKSSAELRKIPWVMAKARESRKGKEITELEERQKGKKPRLCFASEMHDFPMFLLSGRMKQEVLKG